MKIFGYDLDIRLSRKSSGGQDIDTVLRRLTAFYDTVSGISVDPESCMRSPTVHAIVNGIARRLSTMPLQVIKKTKNKGREKSEVLENHWLAKLCANPNNYQNRMTYWLDASSVLTRYANYCALKGQGKTGPVRRIMPMHPSAVSYKWSGDEVVWSANLQGKGISELAPWEFHHVRGPARDFVWGDSPVTLVRETIALEIAAEKFGASFFGNGALPFVVFSFIEGIKKGFKDEADEQAFIDNFQQAFTNGRQFRGFALPVGMKIEAPINVENDKAQFLETRKLQRTVIAGAFGCPPHLVADLERATFNNVEQQSLDLQVSLILPHAMMFEAAIENDFFSPAERANGMCVRFNMDAMLRGDFKTRQEGLAIQRQWGIITANEWREREKMNPDDDPSADEQIVPSNYVPADQLADAAEAAAEREANPFGKPPKEEEPEEEIPVDDPKGHDFWEALRTDIREARAINLKLLQGGKR